MAHTITIETQSEIDFALLKGLAERLGLPVTEIHHTDFKNVDQQAALEKFTGSWRGEETVEELEALIYGARNDQPRDVEL